MTRTILIVDDERNMRWVLERALTKAGYDVVTAERGEQALQRFARQAVDLILLDLKMPGMDGMSVLRELRRRDEKVPILLLTAYATVQTAVEALKIGATDYLRKPFDIETVLDVIARHIADAEAPTSTRALPAAATSTVLNEFIGATPALRQPLAKAHAAQQTPYPVMILGEPGTGRRHLARLIHHGSSATHAKQLVELDCASLPNAVLAHELLAEPGTDEPGGSWQAALGGTLLLANVDALPKDLAEQAVALLTPYLLSHERPHGVRLILTALSSPGEPWRQIAEVAFDILLPPLRERIDDLPLLLTRFAPRARWDREALAILRAHDWAGNVAELQRIVQQAAFLAGKGQISTAHLPENMLDRDLRVAGVFVLPAEGISLETVEEDLIRQALEMANGNKTQAARLLGLSRATLLYRLDKYEILGPENDDAPEE